MSDEEELRRISENISYATPTGETLVSLPDEENILQEMRELGLTDD